MGSSTGSAIVRDDNLFESWITGCYTINHKQINLTWSILKSMDGTLLSIDVVPNGDDIAPAQWEIAIQEFITSVLTITLKEKTEKFFRRILYYYIGIPLDGEYWLPGMRFAPMFDDPEPQLINAERVVCMDIQFNAIDNMNANSLAQEITRRYSARLSLLLDVGLYQPGFELRWVIQPREGQQAFDSVRMQMGFIDGGPYPSTFPKKGQLCPLGKYQGCLSARYHMAGQLFSLPPEARRILRAVDAVEPAVTDAFDRCARLYQVAAVVGRQFPSVGLAYRVAAIEAITGANKACRGFSDFMRKHVRSVNNLELETALEYLYGDVRSAHFHAGQFPMGEYARQRYHDVLMDLDLVSQSNFHYMCHKITREAIVNWIMGLLPDTAEQEDKETS